MASISQPGDRSNSLGACALEVLANWLLCVVINSTEETERVTFSSDPIGGDGIIHDDASGSAFPTEHVYVPRVGDTAAGNIENLILERIEQKQAKGGAAYASGKTLIVFVDLAGGLGIRTRLQGNCQNSCISMRSGWLASRR